VNAVYDKISMGQKVKEHFYCPLLLETKLMASAQTAPGLSHRAAIKHLTDKINSLSMIEQTLNNSSSASINRKKLFLNKIIKLSKREQQSLLLRVEKKCGERLASRHADEYSYASSHKSSVQVNKRQIWLAPIKQDDESSSSLDDESSSSSSSSSTDNRVYDQDENYYSEELLTSTTENRRESVTNCECRPREEEVSVVRRAPLVGQIENEYDDVDSLNEFEKIEKRPPEPAAAHTVEAGERPAPRHVSTMDYKAEYGLMFDLADEKRPYEGLSECNGPTRTTTRRTVLRKVPNRDADPGMYSENSITYTAF
jgi:hypothetical protein